MTKAGVRRSPWGHGQGRQASGLVLRRPVTRSPSFHWPRFLSRATRSKRFRVFRFAPRVLEARKLRCCAINISFFFRPVGRAEPVLVAWAPGVRQRQFRPCRKVVRISKANKSVRAKADRFRRRGFAAEARGVPRPWVRGRGWWSQLGQTSPPGCPKLAQTAPCQARPFAPESTVDAPHSEQASRARPTARLAECLVGRSTHA